MDVDEERFGDDEYNQGEEETDDKDKNANNYKYDIIDEKKANILQDSNHFQVPHESESAKENLFKYSEEYYNIEDVEDILLESDDKDGEEEEI